MSIRLLHKGLKKGTFSQKQILDYFFEKAKSSKSAELVYLNPEYFKKNNNNQEQLALSGVPFIVKDNFCVKNAPTKAGSLSLQSFNSKCNASLVNSLLENGASFLGCSYLDEFAMGSAGITSTLTEYTVNPWSKKNLIAGGSSSGSALSIAHGLSVFSIGSDTGGSTRIPASFCGVNGFKPSYGLISRHGLLPLVNCFDTPTILSQFIEDIEIVFKTILHSKANKDDATIIRLRKKEYNENTSVESLKLGIATKFFDQTHPKIVQQIDRALEGINKKVNLKFSNHNIKYMDYMVPIYRVLTSIEIASNMSSYDGIEFGTGVKASPDDRFSDFFMKYRSNLLGNLVRSRILAGNYFSLEEKNVISMAQKIWRLHLDQLNKIFEDVDFLLTPTNAIPPPTVNDYINDPDASSIIDTFVLPFNLAGYPCLSIPVGTESFDGELLPVGLQIIGKFGSDLRLLEVAKLFESSIQFTPLVDLREEINRI